MLRIHRDLKVMVLLGGPDRERPVSVQSGATVAGALREAGHAVLACDPSPTDTSYLDAYFAWGGDLVFPALHGPWGEGGPLQRLLDQRGVAYVGCGAAAAERCMDKGATKHALADRALPTAPFEVVADRLPRRVKLPYVIKALREGSSFEVRICHNEAEAQAAWSELGARHEALLVEQFIKGSELTIGILGDEVLPPIQIVPKTAHYDYEAKYNRDDTRYLVGYDNIDLPAAVLDRVCDLAMRTYQSLGCRHLSRVDFIVDEKHEPFILEVNTMPGFTSHSLLPMAAKAAGYELPDLVDRLVRMAMAESVKA